MSAEFLTFLAVCVLAVFVQVLAAVPWLSALDLGLSQWFRRWSSWGQLVIAAVLGGAALAFFLDANSDSGVLARWGRGYLSLLHLQLAADGVFVFLWLLLKYWSKGGAVALAAFREGMRQPMFWLLLVIAAGMMAISPFVPYFTFGEDLKMVKELCFAFTMLASVLFGVTIASISVHEEIEGRTAVTLMSKPISRRQFLIGKFLGLLLASACMTILLGWFLIWVVAFKTQFDGSPDPNQKLTDPAWVIDAVQVFSAQGNTRDFARGMLVWLHDATEALPGLVLGFCQVMVLIAIAVTLATRFSMVVNLTICLVVYFLGHLAPIMAEVSRNQYPLVYFFAQLFETIFPGLDHFDPGSAIIRDLPLPPVAYGLYTLQVVAYAVVYTSIALLLGLILFEDKDLA